MMEVENCLPQAKARRGFRRNRPADRNFGAERCSDD